MRYREKIALIITNRTVVAPAMGKANIMDTNAIGIHITVRSLGHTPEDRPQPPPPYPTETRSAKVLLPGRQGQLHAADQTNDTNIQGLLQ